MACEACEVWADAAKGARAAIDAWKGVAEMYREKVERLEAQLRLANELLERALDHEEDLPQGTSEGLFPQMREYLEDC